MYSYGPLHMAKQKQGGQLKPTYSSSVRIRGVALGTCGKWWTIGRGGERGSGISMLMAQQDDELCVNKWTLAHLMIIYLQTIYLQIIYMYMTWH